jgi:diguanylate cyclase (GGDEF)-like protein
MPTPPSAPDQAAPDREAASGDRRHIKAAMAGLALVPTIASIGVTYALLRDAWDPSDAAGDAAAVASDIAVLLAALVISAVVATVVLLRYLLRPIEEAVDSRSELKVLYHQAREESLSDGLTGLGNHRSYQEELGRRIADFQHYRNPFALVLMDLDDLKLVNDHEGHMAGDEMLTSMARAMREMARPEDRLYRIGGDEFAMIMPECEVETAVSVTERLLHFAKRSTPSARSCAFSAGVSGVPQFGRDKEMLHRQADAALYWAKRHGRGTVEVFESERDQLPDNVADFTRNAVQEVVSGRLLAPVFQPIVDLRSGRVLGFEGLIRPDPRGPLPDTARLFAAAAAVGRTVELDVACIEAVLSAARAIGPDRLLTLNLSPRTLEVKDFDAGWLLHGLYRNGISPGRVIVELTERDEIADLPRLRKTFQHLQQYGLRLAADDVGAGNSGLRLLSQVQFDIVKIDLSLVQDGVRRLGARAVLQSLRDLALSQQAHVVAEGVETREQLQVIRELEIGAGQGYLLGRPDVSVEATFVDLGRIGSEDRLRGALGSSEAVELPEPRGSAADGAKLVLPRSTEDTAITDGATSRPDFRSIVLPRGGLRARLEVETRGV